MTGRLLALITALLAGTAFVCFGSIMMITGTASACTLSSAASANVTGYDAEQLHHASIIVAAGTRRGIPARGQIIAVATAIQESSLRNLGFLGDRNDHDSLGLFQQRPSQGWGTPEQILDPEYTTGKFYDKLLTVPGWETMPLAQAAQRVQNSAYPSAYAKHEPAATALVALVGSAGGLAIPEADGQCVSIAGWTHPLPGYKVTSDFRTAERPSHDGVDLPAPKGTPIRAAAAGEVITVLCNVNGNTYSADYGPSPCDADGSPITGGCGWFVQIQSGEFVVRYCHQLVRPAVNVSDMVLPGQIIGVVGTSGNSSGPHLHLEVHRVAPGQSAGSQNAISPIEHFWSVGINLGS